MSNDQHQPQTGNEKTPPKPSKLSAEITESDLWDLDSVPSQNVSEPVKSESIPARRTSTSSTISKKADEVAAEEPYSSPVEKEAQHEEAPQDPIAKIDGEPEAKVSEKSEHQALPSGDEVDPTSKSDKGTAAQPITGPFTKIEKIAITALFAALILGAVLSIIHFSNRVPTRPLLSEETDFPVSGKLIEVKSANTYWRKPITTGEDPDVVRRGTVLIPVVKLALQSKPGAIRVFFRDEEGTVVGDGISRDVSGDEELVIAATAGFDDLGMHAAYRTGEKEPWTVQVFEGTSRTAGREDFKLVLETEVSTDQR